MVINARGEFVVVVRHHDERFTWIAHVEVDDPLRMVARSVVKAVERFIKNEQVGVFDESTH